MVVTRPTSCSPGNAGKSFLLNRIIADLRELYGEDYQASVAVTAATGIAATHIHGEPSAARNSSSLQMIWS